MENSQSKQLPKKSIFSLDSDDELESGSKEKSNSECIPTTSAPNDRKEIVKGTGKFVAPRNDEETETRSTPSQETEIEQHSSDESGNVSDRREVEPAISAAQDCTEKQNTSAEAEDSGNNETKEKLTAFQKAKIERNRQRALLLREARLQAHPYKRTDTVGNSVVIIQNSKLIDTGGGFLIDENDLHEEQSKPVNIVQDPAPILIPERPLCLLCQEPLHDSFLYRSFSYAVCDLCKDDEGKHQLITRTDAKQEYLLKDCDFDLREPALRFILRKNPHNPRWGDMKLYLQLQVEKRALEVWETLEKLEEQHNIREDKRKKTKVKKFNKEVKGNNDRFRKKNRFRHNYVF